MTTIPGDDTTTVELDFDAPNESTFDFNNDDDWYRTTLTDGFTYLFELTAPGGTVAIYDNFGLERGSVSTTDIGAPAQLGYTATRTGEFFVAAEELNTQDVVVPYALVADDSDAQTDGIDGAGSIAPNETFTGRAEAPGDRDWFAVDLVEDVIYAFRLDGFTDNQVEIRDAQGNLIRSERDSSGDPAVLLYTPSESGTFHLVADDRNDRIADYELTFDASDTESAGLSMPGSISVGTEIASRIDHRDDMDWFEIMLEANTSYTFVLDGLNDNDIAIRDSTGDPLDSERSFSTDEARLVFTPNVTGTFYLEVEDRDLTVGDYTLSAFETQVGPPGNRAPVAVNDAESTPAGVALTFNPSDNDTDPENDVLDVVAVGDANDGVARLQNGEVVYTPSGGFQGIDSFTYTIQDAPGAFDTGFVAVTVGTPPPPMREDGVIRGTGRDDLIAVAQNAIYLGREGDDTYLISGAARETAVSVIEDEDGSNVIQLVAGLEIVQSLAISNAIALTLSNGAQVQILNADGFDFDVGGNDTAGVEGDLQSSAEFIAQTLGIAAGETTGGPVIIGDVPPPLGLMEADPLEFG